MKGGYKIIDFKNVSLSGTPVTMTDVLVDLLNNFEKVVLLSHVVLSGSAKDDCFSTVLSDGDGGVKLNCYDGYISINSSGAVTYTVASASGMARDIRDIQSELAERDNLALPLNTNVVCELYNCTGNLLENSIYYNLAGDILCIAGRYRIASIQKTGDNPGVRVTLPNSREITVNSNKRAICGYSSYSDAPRNGEATQIIISSGTHNYIDLTATETSANVANDKTLIGVLPMTYIKLDAVN